MSDLPEFDASLPQLLENFLLVRGWSITGGSEGRYMRLSPRDSDPRARKSLLLPVDDEAVDFQELLQEAIASAVREFDLARNPVELWKMLELATLDDIVKFSKESQLPDGSVDWISGEATVESLRVALVSSAKATVERRAYFGHKFANFASRYLSTVRMGQTERGSFIVTAHSKSTVQIPTSNAEKFRKQTALEGAVITGGEIAETLTRALSTARDVLDASHQSGKVDIFSDAVVDGVSKDLVAGLKLAASTQGYTITSVARASGTAEPSKPTVITFEHRDFGILESAERFLASVAPKEEVTILGRVKVVSRPELGQPGVVNVVVLHGSDASQIKVRLSEEKFAVALEAIRQERLLEVRGTQERDGATFWIYDPKVTLSPEQGVKPPSLDLQLGDAG